MTGTAEIVNASIVCVGAFAPATFTPDWFFKNKLVGENDYESMRGDDKTIISASIAQVESPSFACQISTTRIQIISKDVVRPVINDLAMGMIALLGRVAITSVGINFMTHFQMPSDDAYHKVGDTLVPKGIWQELFGKAEWSYGLTDLAVKASSVPRGDPSDDGSGITIRVQPSAKINRGVLLTYNRHQNFSLTSEAPHSDEVALRFLGENWENDLRESDRLFKKLLKLTE